MKIRAEMVYVNVRKLDLFACAKKITPESFVKSGKRKSALDQADDVTEEMVRSRTYQVYQYLYELLPVQESIFEKSYFSLIYFVHKIKSL